MIIIEHKDGSGPGAAGQRVLANTYSSDMRMVSLTDHPIEGAEADTRYQVLVSLDELAALMSKAWPKRVE